MSKGVRFAETRFACMTVGGHAVYRYSSAVRLLRENGTPPAALAEFEADRLKFGAACNEHGTISDPIIGLMDSAEGKRVAFACPFCSGPEALAAWKAEASTILA